MIAFITQYYRGLGHAMRIKYISDCLPKNSFVVINQLFNPPITYNTDKSYYLEDYVSNLDDEYRNFMKHEKVRKRVSKFKDILNSNPDISIIVCEGFPFCRQQFAYEYISMLEECSKKNIKIVISIRDYPWDEPHYQSVQDWVAKTINLTLEKFNCKILIHGDDKYLPLMADEVRHYYWRELENDIKDNIYYTGYVCNPNIKNHNRTNNNVYISCGLNKEESFYIYNKILKSLVSKNKDLNFIIALGDKNLHSKIGNRKTDGVEIVNYIPNLSEKLESCTAYITYGGYNSTTDIMKAGIPSIIIPRQEGHKLEQLIRCYKFKPLDLFKVCSLYNITNINIYLQEILNNYDNYPNKDLNINLEGANNSAKFLLSL
jgi:predicted glycosyltransferase